MKSNEDGRIWFVIKDVVERELDEHVQVEEGTSVIIDSSTVMTGDITIYAPPSIITTARGST